MWNQSRFLLPPAQSGSIDFNGSRLAAREQRVVHSSGHAPRRTKPCTRLKLAPRSGLQCVRGQGAGVHNVAAWVVLHFQELKG